MIRFNKHISWVVKLIFILTSLLAMAVPVSANYIYAGHYWYSDYIFYDNSAVPTLWTYAIEDGASAWNQSGADFMIMGSTSDNDIITGSGPSWWPAYSIIYYNGSQNLECDMVFNTYYFTFYTDGRDYDVQSIATHEFGHWLSLADTSDSDDIMWGTYSGSHSLSQDDIDGIIYIYGQ